MDGGEGKKEKLPLDSPPQKKRTVCKNFMFPKQSSKKKKSGKGKDLRTDTDSAVITTTRATSRQPSLQRRELQRTKADMSTTAEEEQREVDTLAEAQRLTAASRLMAPPHLTEVCC